MTLYYFAQPLLTYGQFLSSLLCQWIRWRPYCQPDKAWVPASCFTSKFNISLYWHPLPASRPNLIFLLHSRVRKLDSIQFQYYVSTQLNSAGTKLLCSLVTLHFSIGVLILQHFLGPIMFWIFLKYASRHRTQVFSFMPLKEKSNFWKENLVSNWKEGWLIGIAVGICCVSCCLLLYEQVLKAHNLLEHGHHVLHISAWNLFGVWHWRSSSAARNRCYSCICSARSYMRLLSSWRHWGSWEDCVLVTHEQSWQTNQRKQIYKKTLRIFYS